MASRVAAIEKWTAVADICRCLHNFNGVLQICAAFTNAAVYRLKKTWDKVPKTVSGCFLVLFVYVCPGIELEGLLLRRSNKRLPNCKRSSVPMVVSGQCVKCCIVAIRPAFRTWACT